MQEVQEQKPVIRKQQLEIQFQTPVGRISPSLSKNDGASERTLNSKDDLSTFVQNEEGDKEIELISTNNITTHAEITSNIKQKRAALK